jgi:hypothetical protein
VSGSIHVQLTCHLVVHAHVHCFGKLHLRSRGLQCLSCTLRSTLQCGCLDAAL